jgi:hypothetical protein
MARHVVGTREKRYRVDTPHEVSAWVTDEIDTMAGGWVPLTSEREPDGCLRVLYGRLPPELSDTVASGQARPGDAQVSSAPILHTPLDAGWGAVVMLALCTFLVSFVLFARP